MPLTDLHLARRYRTGRQDLVNEFYVPCFSVATSYRRAVGYFSSGALALAAQGLDCLIESGGAVRLVASPQLTAEDISAIERGLGARDDIVERALLRDLVKSGRRDQQRRLEYVAWMLAEGHLEIKIAVMTAINAGIFHEKIGVFDDGENSVAFTGSANETAAAHVGNFESFCVYKGWVAGQREWVDDISRDFDDLWSDTTPQLSVRPLPEAIAGGILEIAPRDWIGVPPDLGRAQKNSATKRNESLVVPADFVARDYQVDAIARWFAASGTGILEMATGTGKTKTALALAEKLAMGLAQQHELPLLVLITCPFTNLVRQWSDELEQFGVHAIRASGAANKWRPVVSDVLAGFQAGTIPFAAIITTNTSLAGKSFQGLIDQLPSSTLVIADEVHNLGTERLADSLPTQARYRLGLSATPDRWLDPDGTARIRDYFGSTVFELSLSDAISRGILCQYDYHPITVELSPNEREKYLELSERIARLMAAGDRELTDMEPDGRLSSLLFARARLIGGAAAKIPAALEAARQHRHEGHILIYCSDAQAEDSDELGEDTSRQVDVLIQRAGMPPNAMSVARYTSRESDRERAELERLFSAGDVEALVAIRCLDEGVDIPQTRTAIILASTTNPRQFIQRRGRVLRQAPGKTHAVIYDLVVSPGDPSSLPPEVFNVERRLFRRELIRIVEFARGARNGHEVLHQLLPLREAWNCLDV